MNYGYKKLFDKAAQIKSLGSKLLYLVNQGVVEKGEAVDEQLNKLGLEQYAEMEVEI